MAEPPKRRKVVVRRRHLINRFNRGFACCGQLDGELVDSLLVSPRRDVQLVGGDFVNNADEDANDERDDNDDALLSPWSIN